FGAFVPLDSPPALVAVDRAFASHLGVDGGALWDGPDPGLGVPVLTAPTEVHVAVTERCPAGCAGCYANATPDGHEPTFRELTDRLDALRAMGVFSVAFGGGEAALRRDIGAVAAHARRIGLAPTMTTSGLGIDAEGASKLAAFAQINVSWDGPAELYRDVRGYDGASRAEAAIRHLRAAGITVGINTVLTCTNYPHLSRIGDGAANLGAVELQLLRWKPAGRGRMDYLARRLTPRQVDSFGSDLRRLADQNAMAVRIDCALVPFLAASGETIPADLARFAVMGCEAGRSLMTLDAHGEPRPCSFWEGPNGPDRPAGEAADATTTAEAWQTAPALMRFRDYVESAPEPCASCDYLTVCRGGCRVVAAAGGDAFRPDPECPRVRRAEARLSEGDRRSASSADDRGD
ncbi:MAG: radical SAM protein, partial [Deltaproteobacteria bacterium]|nr:radical SAM protein [Deltaproteobacteria bacterium]